MMPSEPGIIIMVAPNGARRTKADHNLLPVTAAEVARTAKSCLKAGAAILHLHIRGSKGRHSLDAGLYAETITVVKKAVGNEMIIQITTEAVGQYSPTEQMQLVRNLRPEAVSLALREIIPDTQSENAASTFFRFLHDEKIWPQFILYNAADLEKFISLQNRKIIPFKSPFMLFVLGRYGQKEAVPDDLTPFLKMLGKRRWPWAVCAFGRNEADCMTRGAASGGHLRVGFENNLYNPDGSLVDGNHILVAQSANSAQKSGRKILNAQQIRQMVIKWTG